MTTSFWDRYARGHSVCHQLSAIGKLALTVTVICMGLVVPAELWPLQGVLIGFILLGHTLARIPVAYLTIRLGMFLPILFLLTISLPASQGFAAGWDLMARIFIRGTLAFLAVLWLVNTLPFDELLVLFRRIRVPDVFTATLAFMYRYVFVLWDELARMRVARQARSFQLGSLRFRWRVRGQLLGMLLIRGMGRAERVHQAMCARGWDGHVRTLSSKQIVPPTRSETHKISEIESDAVSENETSTTDMIVASSDPVVVVNRLNYRYPTGREALLNVSFQLGVGTRLGLVGPSGAGKSTLLMHLNGLLPNPPIATHDPTSPTPVTVCGLPVIKRRLYEIRRHVGFLFQDPDDQVFCPTVREDVAFGPLNLGLSETEVARRVTDSLTTVGLAGFDDRATVQLSMGERKRVCLAGVLACSPTLLALDEPSSNLDPRARRTLMALLKSFQGSQIIATHDLELVVELCDQVIVLDEGRIEAEGPTAIILSDDALMTKHGLETPLSLR